MINCIYIKNNMAVIKNIQLQNKIINLLRRSIKESEEFFNERKISPDKDDFHWHQIKALEKLEAMDYGEMTIDKIKRVAMAHGRSDEYLIEESVSYINKGYIPFLFENDLKGLNITKRDYTITFFKI